MEWLSACPTCNLHAIPAFPSSVGWTQLIAHLTHGPGQTLGQSPRPNLFQPIIPCCIQVSRIISPEENQTKAVPNSNLIFQKVHQHFSKYWEGVQSYY